MFILSARARRQLRYYRLEREQIEQTVRRPDRRFEEQASQYLVERVFEGGYYRFGKFCKRLRIEVLYEEEDRDTIVQKVWAKYF